MNGAPPTAMLVLFPILHPALAGELPAGVRFLDPGLAAKDDPAYVRPTDLPVTEAALQGFVRECQRLRQEVKNPKDLALLAGATGGHFYSETTFAVREELEDTLHPERVEARRAEAAQLFLCLTYLMEESLLDLAANGDYEARFRQGFADSLGLEDDLEDEGELSAILAETQPTLSASGMADEFRPSWKRVLTPFWRFVPKEAVLFVADPEIVAIWCDAGVAFAPLDAAQAAAWFPDGAPCGELLVGQVTGWRLLGKNRPQPEAPWLDIARPVLAVKPEAEA